MVVAEREASGLPLEHDPGLPSSLKEFCTEGSPDEPGMVDVVRFSVAAQLSAADLTGDLPRLRTWELVDRLDRVEVVHVCRPATPAGEIAVLAAKALKKRLVVSDLAVRDSTLGVSVGMLDLADVLLCESAPEAELYRGHPSVRVLDGGNSVVELQSVYRDLFRTTRVGTGHGEG
ncbi:MAG: hypothetical protein J2P58_01125 [Acidimicrobiaceae bacterium]|nr:hypothetical protein [Acidimicrobiaceae bacterium]MBO0747806.1 hypothetical protein [Acidimicrobiaceae bacterium]